MYFAGGGGVLHGVQVARIQCCCKVGDLFCVFCFADLGHCFVLLILLSLVMFWSWILFWLADLGLYLVLLFSDVVLFSWSLTLLCFADLRCLCLLGALFSDLRHCFVLLIFDMDLFFLIFVFVSLCFLIFVFVLPILEFLFKLWSNTSFVLKQL